MNINDIHIFVGIKLLFVLFVVISIYLFHKKKSPILFLSLLGVTSASAYALLTNDHGLLFWGSQGDEITIGAMFTVFTKGGWSDFAYHHLPPFYPPAFFWLFGTIGSWFGWNGIIIAKFATFCSFLIFPSSVYLFGKHLDKKTITGIDTFKISQLFFLAVPLLMMATLGNDVFIGKPYEIFTVIGTIFWFIYLHINASKSTWSKKIAVCYGIIAGIIFMTYYLWLIFAAISFIILGFYTYKNRNKKELLIYFYRLFQTMIVALIVGSPFWLPLVKNYVKYGMENWQTAFFVPKGMDLWLPMFSSLSYSNLLFLFGFCCLIYFRNRLRIQPLVSLFITAFIWWIGGLLSLLFFDAPFQEFRGFYLFAPSILLVSCAYGIEYIWNKYKNRLSKDGILLVGIITVTFLSSQFLFGFFIDDPIVKMRRVESRSMSQEVTNIAKFLLEYEDVDNKKLTLHTIPMLMTLVPIDNFIYYNQHNNHPASIFSERFKFLKSLEKVKTSEELYGKIKNSKLGIIEQIILRDHGDFYTLYFHKDKFIEGVKDVHVNIPVHLFSNQYFEEVYRSSTHVILLTK